MLTIDKLQCLPIITQQPFKAHHQQSINHVLTINEPLQPFLRIIPNQYSSPFINHSWTNQPSFHHDSPRLNITNHYPALVTRFTMD